MASHETSIEIDRPVRTVYDQWTQFESFPSFMEGVESVRQVDDTHTRWKVKVGGVEREFDAVVTEQTPDQRVAWKSTDDKTSQAGVVTFHRVGDSRTKVMLQLELDETGLAEKAGERVGIVERRVRGDLARFKQFIEAVPGETGAWRGSVGQDATR